MKDPAKISVLIFFCILMFGPQAVAFNKYAHPKKAAPTAIDGDVGEHEKLHLEDPLDVPKAGVPCTKNARACKIDENIRQFQENVSDLAKEYRSGNIWEEAASESRITKDTKYKFPKYILKAPSYILRGLTWPVAIGADHLLKTGVVGHVVRVISNDDGTFWVYPKIEMGFGTGFGGGVGIKHFDLFHKKMELSAYYQIHVNMNQETGISVKKPDAFYFRDHPFSYKVFAQYYIHHDINYYGMGPDTSQGDAATYNTDSFESGGWLGYNIIDSLYARAHLSFLWNSAGNGSHGARRVAGSFPSNQLVGLGLDTDYLKFGLSLTHDNRDNTVATERGGLRRIGFARYQGVSTTNYDFNWYGIEAVQYIHALLPRHVLVLRASADYQQQTTEGGIPFYMLSKLDVNAPMRGFPFGRFSDRGFALFNVEYRFPIWRFMDGQFFFDTGRVFHKLGDLSFNDFKFTGGGGLRIHTKNYFLMRLQLGYGGEGVRFLIRTSQEF